MGIVSYRRVQIVVLCEDRQQEVFARYFLKKRGFKGNITYKICPSGSQSGEQFVRDEYSKEVKEYRRQTNHLSIGLVVLIDADNNSVRKKLQELDALLETLRKPNEAIAIFVPKRNIETWIHSLQGEIVDEETKYSKFVENQSDCKPYVEELSNQCSQGSLNENSPPSLQDACKELQRILPLKDKL